MNTPVNPCDFGAIGDGVALDTEALQAAIDAAAEEGRCLLLPQGAFRCGTLFLRSHLHLVLGPGSVLLGSKDMGDYAVHPLESAVHRAGSVHTISRRAFLQGEDVVNVTIEGPGQIDGNEAYLGTRERPEGRGPKLILFRRSSDITLRNVTLVRSASWALIFFGCQRVRVLHVNVLDSHADGIVPVCCQDVLIDGCTIEDNGDDCICLKNESPDMTTATAPPCGLLTRHVRIANCVIRNVKHGHPAVKIGTGSFGHFSDILIANCSVENVGSILSIDCMRPTLPETGERWIERVHVHDITAVGVFNLIDIKVSAVYEPVVRDISMSRIVCRGQRYPNRLLGTKESPIRGVTLTDIQASMADLSWKPAFCRAEHVDGLTWRDVTLSNCKMLNQALLATDCSNIEWFRVRFDTLCEAEAAMTLEDCSNATLDRVTAPDAKTVLHARGERTAGMRLREVAGNAEDSPFVFGPEIKDAGWGEPLPAISVASLKGPATLGPGDTGMIALSLEPASQTGPVRIPVMNGDAEIGAAWCWCREGRTTNAEIPFRAPYRPGDYPLAVGGRVHSVTVRSAPTRYVYDDSAEFCVPPGQPATVIRGVTNVGGAAGTCEAECRRGAEVFLASTTLEPGETGKLVWELPPVEGTAFAPIALDGLPHWEWQTTGNVPGRFFLSHDKLTIEAGGRIGEHEDYAAVFRRVEGDFDLIGHFRDIRNTGEYASQGMIFRNDLTSTESPGFSAYSYVPKYMGMYVWRQDLDGDGHYEHNDLTKARPITRIRRRGEGLFLDGSPDGVEWEERSQCTIPSMANAIDVGFYANAFSHRGEMTRARFSAVALTGPVGSVRSPVDGVKRGATDQSG